MERHFSIVELRWRHFSYAVSVGIGIVIGALVQRFYGQNDKKSDLTNAIRSLSDQVAVLTKAISKVKDKSKDSDKVEPRGEPFERGDGFYEEDEEDGDLYFEIAPTKEATNMILRCL